MDQEPIYFTFEIHCQLEHVEEVCRLLYKRNLAWPSLLNCTIELVIFSAFAWANISCTCPVKLINAPSFEAIPCATFTPPLRMPCLRVSFQESHVSSLCFKTIAAVNSQSAIESNNLCQCFAVGSYSKISVVSKHASERFSGDSEICICRRKFAEQKQGWTSVACLVETSW